MTGRARPPRPTRLLRPVRASPLGRPWRHGVPVDAAPPMHAHAAVGASIFQTPGGIQAELAKINSDFDVFGSELALAVHRQGYPDNVRSAAQPLVDLYTAVWLPLQKQWQTFFSENKGWWDNFWWNHAPDGEGFAAQLVEVRARARELGMALLSPTPTQHAPSILFDPQHNLIDRTVQGAQGALGDLWGVLKIGLYGCLGIAGIAAVIAAARSRR